MLETTFLFMKYLNWNDFGSPLVVFTLLSAICGVVKRALSRVLVLLVCLGYGVVRPSLGEEMHRVLYLGGTYCALSLVYAVLSAIPNGSRPADDPAYDLLSIVVFSLAIVDTS